MTAREIRQQMAGDRLRPRYHFLPPSNWMNDPNGVIQWNGNYHLFYQHNPNAPVHADMHWGHAISEDLVHWTDLPFALTPTPGGPDEAGVFSGCAVNNAGVPTLVYTGVVGTRYDRQTQCIATSQDDDLLTWEKYAGNPVVGAMPSLSNQTRDFRDPFVWCDGETWYMVVGSFIDGVGGTVFLYQSPDLIHWDYLHPLLVGERERNGLMWECPNFFKLGDYWVLIVSPQYVVSQQINRTMGKVIYFVGEYVNHQFTPLFEGVLDHGYLYAPLSLGDDQGRRLMWGWLREGRSTEKQIAAGWAGVQSFPRVLSLQGPHLHMEPAPELKQIRGTHHAFAAIALASEPIQLAGVGFNLDLEFEFTGDLLEIALACSPDRGEQTCVIYDRALQSLTIDRENSSAYTGVDRYPESAPHALAPGEALTLRMLLDGSVLEIIANGRTSLSSRIYPTQTEGLGLRVTGRGIVVAMDIWEMPSIWR